jgi:hypothetical protein
MDEDDKKLISLAQNLITLSIDFDQMLINSEVCIPICEINTLLKWRESYRELSKYLRGLGYC